MKRKSKKLDSVMLVGAALMVFCAVAVMCGVLVMSQNMREATLAVAPWGFLVGSVLYVVVQRIQTEKTDVLTIARLNSIRLLSGICFILSGLLMVEQYNGFVREIAVFDINSYMMYMQIVYNNWVLLLLIGSLLQLYTSYRLSSENRKRG